MVLLVVITAFASALLDNVTTVLLVAPVTLARLRPAAAARRCPSSSREAFASNIGGTATLIGDPPNIIIASRAGLSFNDFLVHLAPIVAVLLVVFLGLCRFLFRDALREPRDGPGAARAAGLADLRASDAITDRRLLVRCLVVLALVIAAFALHTALHLEPAMVALLGAGLMVLVSRTTARQYLEEVEWPTLVFFMALFVLVGGLVQVGVIAALGQAAVDTIGDRYLLAATVLIFGSAVLGAFVDNIPYTAAMAPIVDDVVDRRARSRAGPTPVVGVRTRRRPRRQHHRGRRRRERGRHSASPPARATPSASGSSPATGWSSPPSPSSSPGSTCGCATTRSYDRTRPRNR